MDEKAAGPQVPCGNMSLYLILQVCFIFLPCCRLVSTFSIHMMKHGLTASEIEILESKYTEKDCLDLCPSTWKSTLIAILGPGSIPEPRKHGQTWKDILFYCISGVIIWMEGSWKELLSGEDTLDRLKRFAKLYICTELKSLHAPSQTLCYGSPMTVE